MQCIRILVTGAGSGVGQGIIKSLRLSQLHTAVIASDISPMNSALFRTDEYILLPKVEDEDSLPQIITALEKKDIHVVMIGSEFDLVFFSQHKDEIEYQTGAMVVVSPLETVYIANDKWLTVEFLRKNNLPFPESHLPCDIHDGLEKAKEWGYPVLLKTRFGTASRHVHVINDKYAFSYWYKKVPDPMMQRVIGEPKDKLGMEYTCSIFKCRDGSILRPFTARRTLRGGSSWIIEVDAFERFYPLLIEIGKIIPSMGSLNIQLMDGVDGPVPFEFNARFSGTAAVRAYFGFNEPEMVLVNYFLKKELSEIVIRRGLALRYLEEVFIDGVISSDLQVNSLPKGKVLGWF